MKPALKESERNTVPVPQARGYAIAPIIQDIQVLEPMSCFFNQHAINVEYPVKTFQYLAIPYIFFAIGTALRSLFIGTGNTLIYLIPSAAVNLGIYIPLGLLVKANMYTPSFVELMLISFVVFAADLVIVSLLTVREYRRLEKSLGQVVPAASLVSNGAY